MKIFNNIIKKSVEKSGEKQKKKFAKKFSSKNDKVLSLKAHPNTFLEPIIGVNDLVEGKDNLNSDKDIVVGTIRMGYGHYRISMAVASAANSMGYRPLWLDFKGYPEMTGTKIISHLNNLYSLGSRLSQKFKLFDKLYWEPLTSEGFRKLNYNAKDQKMSELFTPICDGINKDITFVATHAWPAQAAVHAGFSNVVNMIPDNWPLGLHLAEGAKHTIQTQSSYYGYKILRGMAKNINYSIPKDELFYTGHYVDHEIVKNIEQDCKKRLDRYKKNKSKRLLLSIGGAGAQQDIILAILNHLKDKIKSKEVTIFLNVGDHKDVWDNIKDRIDDICNSYVFHNDWDESYKFANDAIDNDIDGFHVFYSKNIFPAVYISNILMRGCDFLITKPSELSFYPVPKVFIQRVGGHEEWGAIRSSEVGDGTIECRDKKSTLQAIDLILQDDDLINMYCDSILKNKKIGLYDGAYNVIKLVKGEEI